MDTLYKKTTEKLNQKMQWKRADVASKISEIEEVQGRQSQRKWCKEKEIPRTTLQHWLKRKKNINASEKVINFFESPEGVEFLHQIITAAHFEFSKHGPASVHNVSNFLKLSGLSNFVGASYGTHQKLSKRLDELLIEFGKMEEERLSGNMPKKKIAVCEDETFHPAVCLVAIEAVSNYIMLEKYAVDRTGETWNKEFGQATSNLNVEIMQNTSDEGKGLLNHVEKGLKAHHAPDLFHVQYEITKGTGAALSSKLKRAEKQLETAKEKNEKIKYAKELLEQKRPQLEPNENAQWEEKLLKSQEEQEQAEQNLSKAKENKEIVRAAKIEIGRAYNPYDLITGERREPETIEKSLEECFEKITQASQSLSENSRKHIQKAKRVLKKMNANIAFFFCAIDSYIRSLHETIEIENLMHKYLIPGFYLQRMARIEKNPVRKEIITRQAENLLSILHNREGPFANCGLERFQRIEKTAKECAYLFQRSSSCVEGRNAHLALHHQGLHRLSNQKLQGLTVIHNYYIKQSDGTTAAERFFEAKPKDIFQWILEHLELPCRARKNKKINSFVRQAG